MDKYLFILIFCKFILSVQSLGIPQECTVSKIKTSNWNGENVTVLTWIPLESQHETLLNMTSPLLTIKLESNDENMTYDLIEMGRSYASWTRVINENKSVKLLKYPEKLRSGWLDLYLLRLNDSLVITYPNKTALLSINEIMVYKIITVVGTNVVTNCQQSMIIWPLEKYEGEVAIPLPAEMPHRFNFNIFAKTPSNPVLLFESSNALQLSWNMTQVIGILKENQNGTLSKLSTTVLHPLPAGTHHHLSLEFEIGNSSVVCYVWDEMKGLLLWKVNLTSFPQKLTLMASPNDHLFVAIRRSSITSKPLISSKIETRRKEMSIGDITSLVIIGLVYLGIISLVVISSIFHDKIIGKPDIRPIVPFPEVDGTEEEPLMPDHRGSLIALPTGSIILEEQSLWQAVQSGDIESVKSLLEEGYHPDEVELGRFSTPNLDAHMLGLKEVVQVFAEWKGETFVAAPDHLIKSVLFEMERSMKEIFVAAESGMYDNERGVKALIKTYCLPATIIDNHGRSILHYMASVTDMDGVPVWQPRDIRKFFANQDFYANAIDHFGRTALHELAQHQKKVEANIMWDGIEWSLTEARLAMARLFVSYGCDPRIADHNGKRPDELAYEAGNFEMAKYFEQKCSDLGNIDSEEGVSKFDDLIAAVRQGNISQVCQLLYRHVPLLPVGAKANPLVEAIRCHHRDVLCLLLSAGAPLCNRSIEGVTCLEAAHNTKGLPACFPALIRKDFYDRMEDEIAKLPQEREELNILRQCMIAYNLQVMDAGSKARWIFPTNEGLDKCLAARRLLVQSSELGLPLTCQLLGLENSFLHALPEEPNPFFMAVGSHHIQTQLVLYRDLEMSPFVFGSQTELYLDLLGTLWAHEIKILEEACKREENFKIRCRLVKDLAKLRKLRATQIWEEDEKSDDALDILLQFLVKHGLITILYIMLNQFDQLDIDKVIDHNYNYTMLHIAAAYGKINVIEYLLYLGASLDVLSLGDYTPSHTAAVAGHRKLFDYMNELMKLTVADVNLRCSVGQTAEEIMMRYEEMCCNDSLPVLPHETSLYIKNERNEQSQAYEILNKKGANLNINSPDALFLCSKTKMCKKFDLDEINELICKEIQNISSLINQSGYHGNIIPVGSFHEGFEIFSIGEIYFLYEVVVSENVNFEDIEDEERVTIGIESDSKNSIYNNKEFLNIFFETVNGILIEFEASSSSMHLVHPYISCSDNGISLYWLLMLKDEMKLIQTIIMPVLPVTCPFDDVRNDIPPDLLKSIDSDSDLQLHLINECGEWIYYGGVFERIAFKNLNRNQRSVWMTCLLLARLLRSTWWSSSFNHRTHNKLWHTRSLGCPFLPERGLRTLFLEELVKSQDWKKQNLLERVISIFSRACKQDLMEKCIPQEYINSFITPNHFCCWVRESVCGVLQYLEEIAQAEPLIPDKTVTFAEP